MSCRYLVGCDGARSIVRKAVGAELTGDAVVQRVQSTYIRAPALIGLQQKSQQTRRIIGMDTVAIQRWFSRNPITLAHLIEQPGATRAINTAEPHYAGWPLRAQQ